MDSSAVIGQEESLPNNITNVCEFLCVCCCVYGAHGQAVLMCPDCHPAEEEGQGCCTHCCPSTSAPSQRDQAQIQMYEPTSGVLSAPAPPLPRFSSVAKLGRSASVRIFRRQESNWISLLKDQELAKLISNQNAPPYNDVTSNSSMESRMCLLDELLAEAQRRSLPVSPLAGFSQQPSQLTNLQTQQSTEHVSSHVFYDKIIFIRIVLLYLHLLVLISLMLILIFIFSLSLILVFILL